MSSTIIFGATASSSLGRSFIPLVKSVGSTPIVIGRSAALVIHDPDMRGCEMITADLTDRSVASTVLDSIVDLSCVDRIIIAGGGPHSKGLLAKEDPDVTDAIWHSIALGPARFIRAFHAATTQPYHLVTIASTSALRIRNDETTYATAQTARAVFARNFHHELTARAGSQNTIFYPGGMKTGLWDGTADTEGFMDPQHVADIMWGYITRNDQNSREICQVVIDRSKDGSGTPIVTHN